MQRVIESSLQTGGVGNAATGYVEGSAVVWTGANEGEAQGDVYTFLQTKIFYGDQSLIVILRNHDIEPSLPRLHKDSIAGPGAANIQPFGPGGGNRRGYDAHLFIPKKAALTGMGVQPCDGDAGLCDAKRHSTLMRQLDCCHLGGIIRAPDRLGKRAVDGDQNRSDLVIGEHHSHPVRSAQIGKNLGMARIGYARHSQRFLVNRSSDDSCHASGSGQPDGRHNGVIGGPSGLGRDLPKRRWNCQMRGFQNV